ncbi:MAG TPA: hypothetical protein VGS20_10780 [Candidatus Acidoferrales bacterium]|nr:hypothetical protein [Candidatus Acidoferrales bacterium]
MVFSGARTHAAALVVVLAAAAAVSLGATCGQPAAPAAGLDPGESLRYRVEYRSGIHSDSNGPIYNPEQAHNLTIAVTAVLRLEVLRVDAASPAGCSIRLRATYESTDARVQSDAYDPGADALEKRYRELQNHSFEFTVNPQGAVVQVAGLNRLEPDERLRNSIRQWLSTLTLPLSLWKPGMKPGARWRTETPLVDSPLAGLAWRTETAYRNDEACPPAPGASEAAGAGRCAVIAAHLRGVQRVPRGGATPAEYRRQGLRTSGQWKAHGASLSYVSLATGLVTSTTASEHDDMDVTIVPAAGGSELRYDGQTDSVSQITLIAVTLPPTRKAAGAATGPRHQH